MKTRQNRDFLKNKEMKFDSAFLLSCSSSQKETQRQASKLVDRHLVITDTCLLLLEPKTNEVNARGGGGFFFGGGGSSVVFLINFEGHDDYINFVKGNQQLTMVVSLCAKETSNYHPLGSWLRKTRTETEKSLLFLKSEKRSG